MRYDISNIKLAKKGKLRIEWADENMPVLRLVRERFKRTRPLKGVRLGACLHVTTETAVLMDDMPQGGVAAADLSGNGRDEVIISSYEKNRLILISKQ